METVMNRKIAISVVSAMFLAAGSASAQPIGTVPGDPYILGQHPSEKGYVPIEQQMRRSDRQEARRQFRAANGLPERGAGPNHQWDRGDRLPYEYRHPSYVVNDWYGHGLGRPPQGHYW